MKLVNLTYLVLELNAAIDSGRYGDLSPEEVKNHIEGGDIIPWTRERLGEGIDLSLLDEGTAREITEGLQRILGGYSGNERRKWGIENRGLCLLLAWANELIQQRGWRE